MNESSYSGIGIHGFANVLKTDLSDRIDLFVKETIGRYKDDTESIAARSKSQWTQEFQRWSAHRQGVREVVEKYLLGEDV